MRSSFITAAIVSLSIGPCLAQIAPATPAEAAPALPPAAETHAAPPPASATAPVANPNAPSNPAVKTTEGNNVGAPAAGANSFTEGQAKSRIESRGFSNVSALKKDDQGIWHGTAMKDGKPVQIALDFQGNVVLN